MMMCDQYQKTKLCIFVHDFFGRCYMNCCCRSTYTFSFIFVQLFVFHANFLFRTACFYFSHIFIYCNSFIIFKFLFVNISCCFRCCDVQQLKKKIFRTNFLPRITLSNVWEPASRESCSYSVWKMLKTAAYILCSQSTLQVIIELFRFSFHAFDLLDYAILLSHNAFYFC